jgi:hypothetical protein
MSENEMSLIRSELDYIGWVAPRLARLSARHRAAFAAAAAERQYGTYQYLARKDARLRPEILREALDKVWAHAAGETIDTTILKDAQKLVEPLIPDLDDDDAPEEAPLILDAASAVSYALQACLSEDPKRAEAAGLCATSTVHYWVDGLLRPGLTVLKPEEIRSVQLSIDQHPFMVRELEQARLDMDFLAKRPEIGREACTELRALWPNGPKSNIDLW